MLTQADIQRVWAQDRELGREHLNHFLFCYGHPDLDDTLLIGVRLSCAFDSRLIRYTCPMLSAVWEGKHYLECDFRPDIRKEILTRVGIKPIEETEYYVECPRVMLSRGVNFLTMQSTKNLNRMEEAFWLPR